MSPNQSTPLARPNKRRVGCPLREIKAVFFRSRAEVSGQGSNLQAVNKMQIVTAARFAWLHTSYYALRLPIPPPLTLALDPAFGRVPLTHL